MYRPVNEAVESAEYQSVCQSVYWAVHWPVGSAAWGPVDRAVTAALDP